ncbi:hypothetical protein CRG98_039890 [Punica granatum]|uniref:Uncharacterized protein n=1 Tax=Punica granatum TaxID=22663 RepID=A0A2I0I7S8_PUNGR|nr:hypothetical protein CRG98_039890 [Punica granatum]
MTQDLNQAFYVIAYAVVEIQPGQPGESIPVFIPTLGPNLQRNNQKALRPPPRRPLTPATPSRPFHASMPLHASAPMPKTIPMSVPMHALAPRSVIGGHAVGSPPPPLFLPRTTRSTANKQTKRSTSSSSHNLATQESCSTQELGIRVSKGFGNLGLHSDFACKKTKARTKPTSFFVRLTNNDVSRWGRGWEAGHGAVLFFGV